MERKISRRTVIAGAAVLPILGLSTAMAKKQDSATSTPASSPMASPGASPMASPAASATDITILAEDIKYNKTELTCPANTDVKITLENKGLLEHDFRIDKLDFQIGNPLASGEKATKTLNADKGEYEYYCTVPGHKEAGMVGKLTVG
ncbi:MAG TPA: cupredoxin domain-containing protein [Thermomicrobiales bacterium]|nr:cupredoxin domain-containing protein [Thermomicrobiales bacterium]